MKNAWNAKSMTDHKGIEYPSLTAMCEAYGQTLSLVHKRLDAGWNIEDALTKPSDKGSSRRKTWTYKGKTYSSTKELCKDNGISVSTFKRRLQMGYPMEQAVELTYNELHGKACTDHLGNTYKSKTDMCAYYEITTGQFSNRERLGWSLEKILTTPINKSEPIKDHLGNEFATVKAMCEHYNVPVHRYYYAKEGRYSLEAALTRSNEKPEKNEKEKQKEVSEKSKKEKQKEVHKVKDHLGTEFKSANAMCAHYNIPYACFKKRKEKGWDLETTLTTPVKQKTKSVIIGGIHYSSYTEASKKIGVDAKVLEYNIEKYHYISPTLITQWVKNGDRISNPIQDYNGQWFPSIRSLSETYNVSHSALTNRLKKGWDIKKALHTQVDQKSIARNVQDHKGNTFSSEQKLCDFYSIKRNVLRRKKEEGMSIPEITQSIEDKTFDCIVFDHTGKGFPSIKDMCNHYGMSSACYLRRRNAGWGLKESLINPPKPALEKQFPTINISNVAFKANENLYYYCQCKECNDNFIADQTILKLHANDCNCFNKIIPSSSNIA